MAYCNFLRIRHGSVVGVYTIRLTTGIDTDPAQMLTLAIQHIAETIAGTLAKEVIVPYLPSAAQLFDGVTFTVPKRGRKTRSAGVLAQECPYLPRRTAQEPRDQESRTAYRTPDGRHAKGAALGPSAPPHRMLRQLQPTGDQPGSFMRGIPGRQAFTQGVPPFQHQNRHRCRRLRLDARDRLPPLQPPDRRRSRTARPDYRGRAAKDSSPAPMPCCANWESKNKSPS